MDDELKDYFEDLEQQGWEPQLCDTPVPFYENAVMCGEPADVGDTICGMELYPRDFFDNENEFMVKVKGDSMIGANILEGDKVKVRATKSFNDGDILLVMIDGEYTLKAFCRDVDGKPWLIPRNPKYKAFSPCDYQNVMVRGVVEEVIQLSPRVDYRSCMKEITAAKQEGDEVNTISSETVSKAIKQIAPMVKIGRQWFAVYRAMVDVGVMKVNEYAAFCEKIAAVVPKHEKLPQSDELQRMAVQSFSKPISGWREDDAPVQGKRFREYLTIGEKMKEYLKC